jgi:hypothetical protein
MIAPARSPLTRTAPLLLALALAPGRLGAHDTGVPHSESTPAAAFTLPFAIETKGPIKNPGPAPDGTQSRTSGQGYWTFVAVTNQVLPIPEPALPKVKGAHGTLLVDAERDTVFWGLEQVGWIAFHDRLKRSEIIAGDPVFQHGNLHGADLLPRRGQLPWVVVADNVDGQVYLSDTTFLKPAVLRWPKEGPYQAQDQFHPTDAAFVGADTVYVTDGYGKAWIMPAHTDPLAYAGEFFGGKAVSQTPHGITYDHGKRTLLIAARPEGQIKTWTLESKAWTETQSLPAGSTVCDVDLWDDYALAPCLDGPGGSPGPIYIINLRKKSIAATLRPKQDLGFADAQHIHDAAWYVVGKGRQRELYVLFTNWNPGGVGALKLVRASK